ncbi:MAG: hypothetical protein MI861_25775 [Pirellulales bacterium]|nr:hypothetical protein [Pirellulales bacterium]
MSTSHRFSRPTWAIALSASMFLLVAEDTTAEAQYGRRGYSGHSRYGGGYRSYSRGYGYRGYGYGRSFGYGRGYYPSFGRSYGYRNYGYGRGYYPSYGRSYRYRGYGIGYNLPRYGYSYRVPSYSSGAVGAYRAPSNTPTGGAYSAGSAASPTEYSSGKAANTDHHLTAGPGWPLLAAGDERAALNAFGAQAASNPSMGGPKIGYALAAAACGDLSTGVWAMRRACSVDSNAMHYVQLDDQVRPSIKQLISQYQRAQGTNLAGRDSAFMLASLHYLLGNMTAADTAIEEAARDGDRDPSTTNLARLIADRAPHHVAPQQEGSETGPIQNPPEVLLEPISPPVIEAEPPLPDAVPSDQIDT